MIGGGNNGASAWERDRPRDLYCAECGTFHGPAWEECEIPVEDRDESTIR